ncbi:MAG: hypothetical protein ACK44A_16300 [Roseateles sp.]
MHRLLTPLIPLMLAACAAPPAEKTVPLAAMDGDTICEREARSGTNLPTRRCRTAEQRKAEREGVERTEEARRNFPGMTTGK